MRCYLQCRYGFIPEKNLYRETKSKIRTGYVNNGYSSSEPADYVYNLVQDLTHNDRLQIYNTITAPSEHDAFIVSFLRDSRKSNARRNLLVYLSELKTYKVTQPIVFALLNRYVQESDVTEKKRKARYIHRLLTLLTSFVMRTAFVVPKFEPSHFESAFSNLANKILTDDSWETIQFSNTLRDVDEQDVFIDSKFIEQIKNVKQTSLRETGKAKRFLLGVAYHMQSDITLINQNRYTVEHILPASRAHLSGWVGFDQQSHADSVALFGNLTLLSKFDNRPGQSANSAFNSKREIFKNSAVALTREIGKLNEWSPAEIRKRQNKLAKLSAKVWVIPDV